MEHHQDTATDSTQRLPLALRKALVALSLLIILAGVTLNWWLSDRIETAMRSELLNQAVLIAESVEISDIQELSGTADDLVTPRYARLKQHYAAARLMDPDIHFVYLMGLRSDGAVYFYADSEPIGSPDESPAGQIYDEVDEVIRAAFTDPAVEVIGPVSDRWGTWVTALVPYVDPLSGKVVAIQGVDIDANNWQREVLWGSFFPVLGLVVALLAVLFVGVVFLIRRLRAGQTSQFKPARLEILFTLAVGLVLTLFTAFFSHSEQLRDPYLFI